MNTSTIVFLVVMTMVITWQLKRLIADWKKLKGM